MPQSPMEICHDPVVRFQKIDYPAVEAYMKDEPGVFEAHLAAAPEARKAVNS